MQGTKHAKPSQVIVHGPTNDGNPFLPHGSKQYIFRKVTSSATKIYLFARVHQRQTRGIGHFQNGHPLQMVAPLINTFELKFVKIWHTVTI